MTGAKTARTVGEITASTGDVGERKGATNQSKGLEIFHVCPPPPHTPTINKEGEIMLVGAKRVSVLAVCVKLHVINLI